MPPRLFLSKSAEVIENKRWEAEKKPQESSRVRKRKEVKEIEELDVAEEKISASLVRDGDDGIVVRRWVAVGRARVEILSLCVQISFASVSPGSGRACEPQQRSFHELT